MSELAIGVLALLAIGFVTFPLWRGKNADAEAVAAADAASVGEGDPALADLLSQRDATYRAIKEIEFDYEIGNLSETDYHDLRERYKVKALGLLKAIKEHAQQAGADGEAHGASTAAEAIERAVSRRRAKKSAPSCLRCGAAVATGARFCPSCGQALAFGCPACGAPGGPDDHFCTACGARLRLPGKMALDRR